MSNTKAKRLRQRRTPWDAVQPHSVSPLPPVGDELCAGVGKGGAIRLHGVYIFDPVACTSEDLRRFMWAGLRVLRAEAKVRGLSDDEVLRIMAGAFDVFHDAANGLWSVLQQMMISKGGVCVPGGWKAVGVRPLTESRSIPPAAANAPLLKATDEAKKQESQSGYPVADDLYEPVEHGWTPARSRVLRSLKEYSEATHADH